MSELLLPFEVNFKIFIQLNAYYRNKIRKLKRFLLILETIPVMPMAAFQIYDDLSDAWSQEDDEISDHYLHLRLSLKVLLLSLVTTREMKYTKFFSWLSWYFIGSWRYFIANEPRFV